MYYGSVNNLAQEASNLVEKAYEEGLSCGKEEGREEGIREGYERGYKEGYEQGLRDNKGDGFYTGVGVGMLI